MLLMMGTLSASGGRNAPRTLTPVSGEWLNHTLSAPSAATPLMVLLRKPELLL